METPLNAKLNKLNPKEINRILLIRNDRIGDVFVCLPFIKNLKQINPNFKIDILLSEKNISTLDYLAPYIDKHYVYKKSIIDIVAVLTKLKQNKYDLVIDLHYKFSRTAAILAKLIKSRFTLAFYSKEEAFTHFIETPDTRKLSMPKAMNSLLEIFTDNKHILDNDSIDLKQNVRAENLIGINLSGSSLSRAIPFDLLSKLIDLIKNIKPQSKFLLYCTNSTKVIAEEYSIKLDLKLVPQFDTLKELEQSLSKLSLYITPDTATVQLAGYLDIQQIILYSFISNHEYELYFTPRGSNYLQIFPQEDSINSIDIEKERLRIEEFVKK